MEPQTSPQWKSHFVNILILLVFLGIMFASIRFLGDDTLRAWIENAGFWAPLVLVLAKISTIVFAPLSGGLLYPLAGTLFGMWYGLGLVLLGDILGSSIAFLISRRWGRPVALRMLGGESNQLSTILETIGTIRGFFVTRFVFIMGQDVMSYGAGLTRLPYLPFILIHSAIGLIPSSILVALGAFFLHEFDLASVVKILAGVGLGAGIVTMLMLYFFPTHLHAFLRQKNEESQ